MSNQITQVRLLAVPLENDYKHTLYFSSKTEQYNYFIGKTVFSELNLSYQRKDNIIRYPKHFDQLTGCNYLMYTNDGVKWKYAFITDMNYINDERTDIYFTTDVIQTYLFDYTVKASFVEREHVNDDTVGANTYPENLETGEHICVDAQSVDELLYLKVVMAVTDTTPDSDGSGMTTRSRFNGIYSGVGYMAWWTDEVAGINEKLEEYDSAGKGEAVQSIFLAPAFLAPNGQTDGKTSNPIVNPSEVTGKIDVNHYYKVITDDIYTPRNKKLLTYPYKYLLVSNNNGGSAVYKYEKFYSGGVNFTIEGALTPGCSIRLVPNNYNGINKNNEEGLNLGKYPICNWTSDVYTNWLTQNGINIGINLATSAIQIAGGAMMVGATGGAGSAIGGTQIVGGVTSVANQLAQIHSMSLTPPQAKGNTNAGDVVTASGTNTFWLYAMSIKPEYAKIIDGFFDMFGYKCNQVKIPLKNHRQNYWYTKTIDVSIDGAIPNNDMRKIKECYNNGITFWKNPNNIGDYSVSNSIVS